MIAEYSRTTPSRPSRLLLCDKRSSVGRRHPPVVVCWVLFCGAIILSACGGLSARNTDVDDTDVAADTTVVTSIPLNEQPDEDGAAQGRHGQDTSQREDAVQTDTSESDQRVGAGEREIVDDGEFRMFVAEPDEIDLVWRNADQQPYGQLERARQAVESDGRTVHLILNAGIYTPGLAPAGLHVENGAEARPLNLNDAPGNFHLLPNGVFSVVDGVAAVTETTAFGAADIQPRLAVQSGPMLLIDGDVHPAFDPASTSRFVRNGVGVRTDGSVLFAQSTGPVTFWEFAQFFLAHAAPNALYLDGSIVRMESPTPGSPIFPNIPLAAMLVVAT